MYLYFLAHETKMARFTTYVGTGNNLVTEKKQKKKQVFVINHFYYLKISATKTR